MKRHPFRRGFIVVTAYLAVALGLALVQFSNNTGFTMTIGSLTVSGKYAKGGDAKGQSKAGRKLVGPLAVFFNGMEFRLAGNEGLASVKGNTAPRPIAPASFENENNAVRIVLEDGTQLSFMTEFVDGEELLQARAAFPKGVTELRLPFRPLRSARSGEAIEGKPSLIVAGESFVLSGKIDNDKRAIILNSTSPTFAYGKFVAKKGFDPADFSIAAASDAASYNRIVQQWTDTAFVDWERSMAETPDEDSVVTYTAESSRRGNYRGAVAGVPKAFLDGTDRTYRSAVYFGRLDQGLRTYAAAERDTLGRLSKMVNERDPALFIEPDLISYLDVRGNRTLLDAIAAFTLSFDPTAMTPRQAAGFLEYSKDWKRIRPNQENPFDRLEDQSLFVFSGLLRKTQDDRVFLVENDTADSAFNLRAGRALIKAMGETKNKAWENIGRSLIVSALSLADASATLPTRLSLPAGAATPVPADGQRIPASRIYRFLHPEDLLPRTVPFQLDTATSIWIWTGAPIRAARDGNAIDIATDFPVGTTHYLLVRGVKPFVKIQLYGIDFRTDPRFERYDSSGWAYSQSEQTLMLKIKHRNPTEHIRIVY